MEANLNPQNNEESLAGISGWLIVFIVFVVLNLVYSVSKCFIFYVGLETAVTTLIFTSSHLYSSSKEIWFFAHSVL